MKKVTWADIEPVLRSEAEPLNAKQLAWLKWCWVILEEFGKTSWGNEVARAAVLMRASVLVGMLAEFEFLVMDKPVAHHPEQIFQRLCDWLECSHRAALGPEVEVVAKTLQEDYRPLNELRQRYDRSDRSSIPWYDLQEDMERTLPLLGDSIQDHYSHPMIVPNSLPEDEFDDLDEYVEHLLDDRFDRIWRWFDQGMKL